MTTPLRSHEHVELSARDIAMLEFERQWWRYPGAKEQGIRERFDISTARYYQILATLIETPMALAHDPLLVKRLRRLRERKAHERSARSLGVSLDD